MGDAAATPPPRDTAAAHRRSLPRALPDVIRTTARAFEFDRYLAALLAPRAVRQDLVTLAAFAGEIARIPSFVSEPMMGEIRLQWWRDGVASMNTPGSVTGHPIADALTETVRRHALPADLLEAAIDAQSDRLREMPFASTAALLSNIDQFDGALATLAWHILASGNATAAQRSGRAASPPSALAAAARAYGVARTLLEMPSVLANRRVLLPADRLAELGLTLDELHLPRARPGLAAITDDLARQARTDLDDARAAIASAPRPLRMAILPAALVRPYLRVSDMSGDAPLAVRDIAPLSRATRLWIAARVGVF